MNKLVYRLILVVALAIAFIVKAQYGFGGLDSENHVENALIVGMTILLLQIALIVFSYFYRKRKGLPPQKEDNLIAGLNNIFFFLASSIIFLYLMSLFGVSPLKLITSLSIVAAAIAVVSREFIASVLAGFAISFSNVLSIGDYVKIVGMKGVIRDVSLTKIQLLTDEGEIIFVSNDRAYHGDIVNYTKGNTRRVHVEFEINSDLLDTVEELEQDIIQALDEYDPYILDNSFDLRTEGVKKDLLIFKFYYTMEKLDKDIENSIRKKTVRSVINFLQSKKAIKSKTDQSETP